MSGSTAPVRKLSQVEVYVGEVITPDREADVAQALPAGVDFKRFKHSLAVAVMQNPSLMKVHPGLLFREVAKSASLGLSMDPQLGEAYLVIVRNSKANRDEPQLRVGYKGLIRLSRQSGEIALVYAHAVHQADIDNDNFHVVLGDNLQIHHTPDVFSERGPIVGYYAVLRYRDGEMDFEPMSVAEIHKIRDRTDAYRAYKGGRIKSTPWADFESEMARKTVIRRLLKRAPMSAEMQAAVRMMDEEDEGVLNNPDDAPALPPQRRSNVAALREIAAPAARARGGPKKPATPEDEPGTEDEPEIDPVDIPEDSPLPDVEPLPGSDEPIIVDTTSPDYARGMRDFHAGLKKCVKAEILNDPKRMTNWQGGYADAREESDAIVEREANNREDDSE